MEDRDRIKSELETLDEESDKLQRQISQYQKSLPAEGISVVPAARRSHEATTALFQAYVADRTRNNWRFYPYSLIVRRLFEGFQNTIMCASPEDFHQSFNEWKARSLSLTQLRQAASQAVLEIGRNTSLISGNRPTTAVR